ncbi:MAG: hypothetical protein QOE55_5247 [Acidobacteriaceae bacterium]|nr:hypothetical protein [Acidobacteriaceae bacterium]
MHSCGGEAALAHHEDQVCVVPPDGQRVSIPRLKGVSHIRNGLPIFRIESRVKLISIGRLHVHIAGLAKQGGDVGIFFLTLRGATKTEHVAMLSGDEGLRELGDAVRRLDLGLTVPKESQALLLRSAVLFCSTEVTCEFVLTPPESANVK